MKSLALLVATLCFSALAPTQVPADKKAFSTIQDELLKITGRLTALQKEKKVLSPADKREIEHLKKRFKDLSMTALSMALPRQKPEPPLPPVPERPLGAAELKIRGKAHALAKAEFERRGRAKLAPHTKSCVYAETILLDHPALGAVPDYRFYLAKIDIEFFPPEKPGPFFDRFVYQLVVFDRKANAATMHLGFGPGAPLEPLLAKGAIAAPTDRIARQIQLARAVLARASRGANVLRKPGATGLSRAELDKRFGLGKHAADHRPRPHRVFENATHRFLLTYRMHADDFGMPLQLMLEWHRFARKGGKWTGREARPGPVFDSKIRIDDARVVRAVGAFVESLGG